MYLLYTRETVLLTDLLRISLCLFSIIFMQFILYLYSISFQLSTVLLSTVIFGNVSFHFSIAFELCYVMKWCMYTVLYFDLEDFFSVFTVRIKRFVVNAVFHFSRSNFSSPLNGIACLICRVSRKFNSSTNLFDISSMLKNLPSLSIMSSILCIPADHHFFQKKKVYFNCDVHIVPLSDF